MRTMDGQLVLFGGLCPSCGVTSAYVKYRKRVIRILLCMTCNQVVEDLSCGYADAGEREPRSGNRG
jgi:hypothetical protein